MAAVEPRRARTPRTSRAQDKTPAERAFAALLADRRLCPFDKLLLSILGTYCLAPGNAWAWPGSSELAEVAGVDHVADGGEARVNRSLARLERAGALERVAWYDLGDWLDSVGRPRLGLDDPRDRAGGSTRRFLLLWWKVPGLGDDFAVALRPHTGARSDRVPPGAGARYYRAPEAPRRMPPAPGIPISSKSERWNQNVNVNAAHAPEDGDTPEAQAVPVAAVQYPAAVAPPDPDRARAAHEIIRKCQGRGWRVGPDGSLDVLPSHRGIVEAPTEEHRAMLARVLPEVLAILYPGLRPGDPETSTTVDLIRRLVTPCGPEAVEAAARKLAAELDDLNSLEFHRLRLAEVRDGKLKLKTVLAALSSSAGAGVVRRAAIYTKSIETGRGRV